MGILTDLVIPLGPVKEQLTTLSTSALVFGSIASFCVIATLVNVLQQLLFADPNKPPVVFHIFPFFGSTVIYGIDPYKFFFACQEKVQFLITYFGDDLNTNGEILVVWRYIHFHLTWEKNDGVSGSEGQRFHFQWQAFSGLCRGGIYTPYYPSIRDRCGI